MKIVIYILLIAMTEIRYNIGIPNNHRFHKTNMTNSNEGKDVQGEDFIFYSASIVFYRLYYTLQNLYIQQKPISILQELQESLGVKVVKVKVQYHGKLLG